MLARSSDAGIAWSRWLKAQEYEQGFWRRLGDDIETGSREQLDWYNWRAGRLTRCLSSAGVPRTEGKVLEIGSGPIGIVNFLDWGERYAIDPLERYYRSRPSLVSLRQPGVTYLDGAGEQLPFENGSCSLVIVDNVIDHTYAPGRILEQTFRVLRPDGHLYLSVNVHSSWGALLHDWLAVLQIDKGHPYTYTSVALQRLLRANRFDVIGEQVEDYRVARRADRESPSLKARIKGYTGLSEFSHAVLCRKHAQQPPPAPPAPPAAS